MSDGAALALLIQGLTAWHLYRTAARLEPGDSVVVHLGGRRRRLAGRPARQAARRRPGDRDRVELEDKRALARELGADAAVDVDPRRPRATRSSRPTAASPVDVILEMAGGRVFDASLDALAPFGRLVVYGISSREPQHASDRPPDAALAGGRRLLAVPLPGRPERSSPAPLADLFARAARGELRVLEGETYPLSQAAARTRT